MTDIVNDNASTLKSDNDEKSNISEDCTLHIANLTRLFDWQ